MVIHTLHLEHVWLLSIYTLLTVANSLLYKNMKGIHFFSAYTFFALLGAISVAARGSIPDFLSIVVGNLFVVAAYLLLFLSLAALFGARRPNFWVQGALIFLGVVTMLQWGLFQPNTALRLNRLQHRARHAAGPTSHASWLASLCCWGTKPPCAAPALRSALYSPRWRLPILCGSSASLSTARPRTTCRPARSSAGSS